MSERCWVCQAENPVDGHMMPCPWVPSDPRTSGDDIEGVSKNGFIRWLVARKDLEKFLKAAITRLFCYGETTPTPVDLSTREKRAAFVTALLDAYEEETNVAVGRRLHEERSGRSGDDSQPNH